MKIVLINRDLYLEFLTDTNSLIRMKLPANEQFVLSDGVTQSTLGMYGKACLTIQEDFDNLSNRYQGQDLTNKSLISIREGGAGDLLFKTPVFRYLKEKYPSCRISVACLPSYHSLLKANPHINSIYGHILPYSIFKKYDYFSTFEGILESGKESQYVNVYDLFAKRFGIDPSEIRDKTPVLTVPEVTREYWKCVLKHRLNSPKKIGLQLRASSPIRTIPPATNAAIVRGLTAKGYKVFLIDAQSMKRETAKFIAEHSLDGVIDISKYSDNFERMIGAIDAVDLIIAPDSSGNHIAAALGKPLVGLFGPFRSDVRLKYYKNAVGIDALPSRCGNGCFIHTYDICNFAKDLGEKYAPCWKLLSPDIVVQEADKLYRRVYG